MGFSFGDEDAGLAAGREMMGTNGGALNDGLGAGREMMGLNGGEVESPRKDGGFSREMTDKIVKNMRESDDYGKSDERISDELERMGYDYQRRAEQVGVIDGMTGWGRKLTNGLVDAAGMFAFGPAYGMAAPVIRAGVDLHQAASTGADVGTGQLSKAIGNAAAGLITAAPAFKSLQMEAFLGGHSLLGGGTAGMVAGSIAASIPKKLAGMVGEAIASADLRGMPVESAQPAHARESDPVGRRVPTLEERLNQIRKFDLTMKGWGKLL